MIKELLLNSLEVVAIYLEPFSKEFMKYFQKLNLKAFNIETVREISNKLCKLFIVKFKEKLENALQQFVSKYGSYIIEKIGFKVEKIIEEHEKLLKLSIKAKEFELFLITIDCSVGTRYMDKRVLTELIIKNLHKVVVSRIATMLMVHSLIEVIK